MKGRAQVMSSKKTGGKDTWLTPPCVLDRVRRIGEIGLDPCTNDRNPVGAMFYRTSREETPDDEDGLARWPEFKTKSLLVFVNPPYSQIRMWAEKVAIEATKGYRIISLVPARTDTLAWRMLIEKASIVAFWHGRLSFIDADTGEYSQGAPFPSAIVGHNMDHVKFRQAFSDVAWVVTP